MEGHGLENIWTKFAGGASVLASRQRLLICGSPGVSPHRYPCPSAEKIVRLHAMVVKPINFRLPQQALQCKVYYMKPDWAEENLQTIRTLMERSAIYRRALAPIMIFAGLVGLATMGLGLFIHMDSTLEFSGLWLGAAVVVVAGALFLARRQALKDREPFWSP